MCGIAGFVSAREAAPVRLEAVKRMCGGMVPRGPDEEGFASNGPITLGLRRLAIFDPANGQQPMTSADGRCTIVFNGAIYNFRALRDELAAAGYPFRTHCDTEVLLAAYGHWRENCLARLRGMFAFAVWDAEEQSLFLARDPFGIKPLYFHEDGDRLLFASELNALLAARVFSPKFDPQAVADYLAWFAVPAPRTIYRHVLSLRAGECATWRDGRLTLRTYWELPDASQNVEICATREAFDVELRARLEDTIRAHLAADVPIGAFLSGGLDSAAIVGLMTHVTGAALKTFSIGFTEEEFSEAEEAAETARHIGTDHHTFELTGGRLADDLESIIDHLDHPTGDGINTYYVSKAARAGGVTVALSGLGGDELFGGYPSFQQLPSLARWLPRWSKLPEWLRNTVIGRLRNGRTRTRKLADFLQHAHGLPELAAMQRRVLDDSLRLSLLDRNVRRQLTDESPLHPEYSTLARQLADADPFATVSAWELRTYMPDVLLRDSDVMSMQHSLELRVPFIDQTFSTWLWRQPARFKDDSEHPKSALANAVAALVPRELQQRRKRGFTLPFAVWMKAELKPFLDETFATASIGRSGLFSRENVQALWRRFQSGDDTREWSRVWTIAVLIAFVNRSPSR